MFVWHIDVMDIIGICILMLFVIYVLSRILIEHYYNKFKNRKKKKNKEI